MDRRELELAIFSCVDRLIDTAIATSTASQEDKEKFVFQGAREVETLGRFLQEMLDGKVEYLPATIRQLVTQKLPDPRILSSFGHFASDLELLIERGLEGWGLDKSPDLELKKGNDDMPQRDDNSQRDLENKAEKFEVGLNGDDMEITAATKEKPGDEPYLQGHLLTLSLRQIFPQHQIQENYSFHGTKFDCYLPEIKLAVDVSSVDMERLYHRKEYYCRREGITWVLVDSSDLQNHKRIERHLMRKRQKSYS